jgi:four helix bundle protein
MRFGLSSTVHRQSSSSKEVFMPYKFEQLEVWQLAIEYVDDVYFLAEQLPRSEDFNLKSQITRAAVSIALNVAEGSTGQSDLEQARFLGMAIRSLIETIACQHLIRRRKYLSDETPLDNIYLKPQSLARKLQAFRKSLSTPGNVQEESAPYSVNSDDL